MSNAYKDYINDLRVTFDLKMWETMWLYDGWKNTFIPKMMNELFGVLGPYVEDFMVYQIKEKFGSLTVYWGWRYRDYTDEKHLDITELDNTVMNIIDKYRKISDHTCVKCGGKATFLSSHWVIPWCDSCRDRKLGVFGIIED